MLRGEFGKIQGNKKVRRAFFKDQGIVIGVNQVTKFLERSADKLDGLLIVSYERTVLPVVHHLFWMASLRSLFVLPLSVDSAVLGTIFSFPRVLCCYFPRAVADGLPLINDHAFGLSKLHTTYQPVLLNTTHPMLDVKFNVSN